MIFQRKLLLYVLALVLVPMMFVLALTFSQVRFQSTSFIEDHLNSVAVLSKKNIESIFEDYDHRMEGIASRTRLRALLKDYDENNIGEIKNILNDAVSSFDDVASFFLLSENKDFLISSNDNLNDERTNMIYRKFGFNENVLYLDADDLIYLRKEIELEGDVIGLLVVGFEKLEYWKWLMIILVWVILVRC